MAQAFRRRTPVAKVRSRSQVITRAICGGSCDTRTGSFSLLPFPPVTEHSTNAPYYVIYHRRYIIYVNKQRRCTGHKYLYNINKDKDRMCA
jgi:hypothetical protein